MESQPVSGIAGADFDPESWFLVTHAGHHRGYSRWLSMHRLAIRDTVGVAARALSNSCPGGRRAILADDRSAVGLQGQLAGAAHAGRYGWCSLSRA